MRKVAWLAFLFQVAATEVWGVPQAVNTGVLFLTVPPSTRSWGMGGAGGAVIDPFVGYYNPGGLGIYAIDNPVGISMNSQDWLPEVAPDIVYRNTLILAGMSFRLGDSASPTNIGIGAAYHRQVLDYATLLRTDENGLASSFHSFDRSNNFTLAIAVERGIELGVGSTYKSIKSVLDDQNLTPEIGSGTGTAGAWDFGVYTRIRLPHALFRLGLLRGSEKTGPFTPDLSLSLSHSWSNRGGDIAYIDAQQSDPLPRAHRLAGSISAGCDYREASIARILIGFDNEKDEVGDGETTYRRGFEVGIFGIFQFRAGQFWRKGWNSTHTIGGSIHLNGVLRWWNALAGEEDGHPLPWFVRDFDAYFHAANVTTNEELLSGTKFREFGVTLNLPVIR